MELSEYQTRAVATDQRPGEDTTAVLFPIVGLASEVGSLTRHVKKWLRDGDAYELFASEMADEIGDILWYCANVASKLGLSMDKIALANLHKVAGRWPTQTSQPPLLDEAYPVEEQLPGGWRSASRRHWRMTARSRSGPSKGAGSSGTG